MVFLNLFNFRCGIELRKDLRNIRVKVEERINTLQEEAENRPQEEEKLIAANPTSVEHIK